MLPLRPRRRAPIIAAVCLFFAGVSVWAQAPSHFPVPETLSYRVEWHMVTAGNAILQFKQNGTNQWQINLDLESVGLVNKLYRVMDKYSVESDGHFCPASSYLDAQEGKKHTQTRLTFDAQKHTVTYHEHDAIKGDDKRETLNTQSCTHEVAGALASLSQLALATGKTAFIPITNGKKAVSAKVEAQAKEPVVIDGKTYNAVRYEAWLFDNVLYKRRGRLFLWITDDADRTPVQFRIELGFPVGNILLQLEKQQKF